MDSAMTSGPRPAAGASLARKWFVLLAHAFVAWALCGATMGIGQAVTTEQTAIVVHAVAAPFIFALVSRHYFVKYGYTGPLATAAIFTAFVVLVDFFLVALVILRSVEMFGSALGTWIPFTLGFLSTYVTGRAVEAQKDQDRIRVGGASGARPVSSG